ncbi:Uncharacterised protein [Actinobaculum suis]|uniref:Uncharacterized protein n=1 Tax=Actinobaculum suis TaxID=1657 RepID=A0A7Z8YB92_9ACTO|nr:Uncharacterised protein [Actinobaculum suis]
MQNKFYGRVTTSLITNSALSALSKPHTFHLFTWPVPSAMIGCCIFVERPNRAMWRRAPDNNRAGQTNAHTRAKEALWIGAYEQPV